MRSNTDRNSMGMASYFQTKTTIKFKNMENGNEVTVLSSDVSEIEALVSVARQFPRDEKKALEKIERLATFDEEIALDCFYAVPRKDEHGNPIFIEGCSVRFAEIVASQWGNLRVASKIISNDGNKVVSEAFALDLETNVAIKQQCIRSIKTKNGNTYSQDMQTVVSNAACAVAFRNVVYKIVPAALFKNIRDRIKEKAVGNAAKRIETIEKLRKSFKGINIDDKSLLQLISKSDWKDVTNDDIINLRGVWGALKEGSYSVEQMQKDLEEKKSVSDKKADMKKKDNANKIPQMP
ncbi:hypothetical protein FACS1894195_0600 [Bacteroidia bacterium]|nr:hypothetical protein FACS1894195_0600 [Bacteroidia bacterium]